LVAVCAEKNAMSLPANAAPGEFPVGDLFDVDNGI